MVVFFVLDEIAFVSQDVAAVTEQMAVRMGEPDVGDDFAFALDFLVADLACVFRVIVDQMFRETLSVFKNSRAGLASGQEIFL